MHACMHARSPASNLCIVQCRTLCCSPRQPPQPFPSGCPRPTQRACKKLGLGCVAVFTEPDALSLHVLGASESVCLGASPKEYLNAARLIEVAKETGEHALALVRKPWRAGLQAIMLALHNLQTTPRPSPYPAGCDAVFPGYGFLSESTEFSALCEEHGIAFIGPTAGKAANATHAAQGVLAPAGCVLQHSRSAEAMVQLRSTHVSAYRALHFCTTPPADTMRMFAQKHTARELAERAQVRLSCAAACTACEMILEVSGVHVTAYSLSHILTGNPPPTLLRRCQYWLARRC